jgi:hypothetical protein
VLSQQYLDRGEALNAEPDRIDEMDDVGPELAQGVEERRGQETTQIRFIKYILSSAKKSRT